MRRLTRIGFGILIALVLLTQLAPTSAAGVGFCPGTPTPCDLGGGTVWNRNYVLQFQAFDAYGQNLNRDIPIYFKGQRQNLTFHGKFGGVYRWGISTAWAYAHPNWKDRSNWSISYPCMCTR